MPFLLYSQLKLNKIFFPFDSNNYYLYENQTKSSITISIGSSYTPGKIPTFRNEKPVRKENHIKHDLKGHEMKNIHKKRPEETQPERKRALNNEYRA